MGLLAKYKELSLVKKAVLWISLFFIFYTFFGFFILPLIFQKVTISRLTEVLDRKVELEKVKFNPYTLILDYERLQVGEKKGEKQFISIHKLTFDLQSGSLITLSPVVNKITMLRPSIRIIRFKEGPYNFSDLIPDSASDSDNENIEKEKTKKIFTYSLSNISVQEGEIEIIDMPKDKTHMLTQLNFGIPFVSNAESYVDTYIKPYFNVNVNGSQIDLKANSKPFIKSRNTQMDLEIKDIELKKYFTYVPFKTGIDIAKGTVDLSCTIEFAKTDNPEELPDLFLTAVLGLNQVDIRTLDGRPLYEMENLNISLDRSDILKGNFIFKKILFSSPKVSLFKKKDGQLNIGTLMPDQSENKDEKPLKNEKGRKFPFNVAIKKFKIDDSSCILSDSPDIDLKKDQLFSLPLLEVENIEVDSKKQLISFGSISGQKGNLNIRQMKDNKLNVETFSKPEEKKNQKDKETSKWNTLIENILVDDFQILANDLIEKGKGNIDIGSIKLESKNFTTAIDQKADINLSFKINKESDINLKGIFGINPLKTELGLKIDNYKLSWLLPFLEKNFDILISDGTFSTQGEFKAQSNKGKELSVQYLGDAEISKFVAAEKSNRKELIKFDELGFEKIDFKMSPISVSIGKVLLNKPFSNIIVEKNGTLNLSKIVRKRKETEKPEEKSKENIEPVLIEIGLVVLKNGEFDFKDRSVDPNFNTSITNVNTVFKDLSSKEEKQSNLEFNAKLNNHAPIAATGKINPFKKDLFLNMKVNLADMDLGFLSPYSGKHAGYKIQKGKLSLDLNYSIDQRKVDLANDLFLDQFEFGEPVESEDAIDAPFSLAIALLKDTQGKISLNFPVKGDLDDPEFSVGEAVFKMIMNLFTKVATAPFALLGSMFGGMEDLNIIEFSPGSSDMNQIAHKKVETLVKALEERPGLAIEIAGYTDIENDRKELAKNEFHQILKIAKLLHMTQLGNQAIPIEKVVLLPEDFPTYTTMVYNQALENEIKNLEKTKDSKSHKKSASTPISETKSGSATDKTPGSTTESTSKFAPETKPEPTLEQMEKSIRKSINISDDELKHLVSKRVLAVKGSILANEKIESKRIFTIDSHKLEPDNKGNSFKSSCTIMTLK